MKDISLSASANQTFSIQLDDRNYTIVIHSADDRMVADITRDDVLIVQGQRITPGTAILPYQYQEAGNFILITNEGDLPDYSLFGVTQFLVYLTAEELTAYRKS